MLVFGAPWVLQWRQHNHNSTDDSYERSQSSDSGSFVITATMMIMMTKTTTTTTMMMLKDNNHNDDRHNLNRRHDTSGFCMCECKMLGKAVAYSGCSIFQILAYILQINWCNRQVQQHVQTRAKAPGSTCHELTPEVTEMREWVKAGLQGSWVMQEPWCNEEKERLT